jgi:hypothetical protein
VKAEKIGRIGLTALLVVLAAAGCGRDKFTNPATAPNDPIVFDDGYGEAVTYQAFMNSKLDAVQVDFADGSNTPPSLRVTVPGPGHPTEWFAGGAFTTFDVRDLSSYNALTFYAKSEMNVTLDVAGLANDNTGTSLYQSSRDAIPLTTDWEKVVVPIPNPSRLTAEGGLFFFAEGHENNQGYNFWMDEVKFEYIESITNPRPFMDTRTQSTVVGAEIEITGTGVTFDLGREDVVIDCLPACLDYVSSDETVATVADGIVTAVGSGTARITARLDTVAADGELTVNVLPTPDEPATPPTVPPEDVISLFSDVYDDVPVDTWFATWSTSGGVADMSIAGDNMKVYTDFAQHYAGIEFVGENLIDAEAAGMTHFHMDVWAPTGGSFLIKLVDFGPNGTYDGPPADPFAELMFNGGTTPAFFSGQWSYLEIPLSAFEAQGLSSMAHLAQIVISSSDVGTVIVDNVYFHR